jgi:hypothetical protein
MLYTSDENIIRECLVGRVALEQEISLALSQQFNTGELHRRLKAAVWASFVFLEGLKDEYPLKIIIDRLESVNDYLFQTTPKTIEGVLASLNNGVNLTPEQCGNLIRFYGEVIDSCKEHSAYFIKERAKQIGWRYGGGGEAFKASRDSSYVAKADRGSVWQKVESNTVKGGRIRVKAGSFFNNVANPYYDLIPGNLFLNQELKDLHVGKKNGGVMVWKIEDTSTIGKIDRTFGLPFGADISGTTTDNLYFLTGWADISKGDPLLMMLPLAAIVGEYHHSLLEVAGAMSLKKVISYSIGFYTTLMPTLPSGVNALSQRADIFNILENAEKDPRNKHVLLHYSTNNKIAGCFMAESSDLDKFKKLATVDIRLWPKFSAMKPYPQEDEIMQLLGEVGLVDAALSSRRGALRRTGRAAQLW